MANLLTITKETDGYFTFVLNGDSANAIKNIRNDLLTIGNLAHFKTANGANLIKEQDVIYSNVTIIDGVSSVVPTSVDDLFNELDNVGFFDWINGSGGTGGVDRYEELIDTEPFFGNDGKVPIVDEAEMKLKYISLPDVSYLDKFPTPLVSGKMLVVNDTATNYIFVDALNTVTQEIRSGYTETSTSEDALFNALSTITSSITAPVESADFERLLEDQQEFIIPTGKTAKWATVNYAFYVPETTSNVDEFNTFTQTGDIVIFKETLVTGNYPVIFYQ